MEALRSALPSVFLAAIALVVPVAAQPAAQASSDWREEYAYTLGVQAYVFGFPWIYLPTLRWVWVTQPPASPTTPSMPLNQFWHSRVLTDAAARQGGSPNNDTLYSVAWVDVGKEPLILSVPEIADRYYTIQLASMDSDNFAYVGTRATGTKAGSYAIVGPDRTEKLPAGVKALPPSRTSTVLIVARTLVDGPADLPAAHAIQDQYRLTPLHLWGQADARATEDRHVWPPFDPKSDPLGEWKTMNRAMTENPPEARHADLMALFATVGIGPGQDVERMDEVTKRGLVRAAKEGRRILNAVNASGLGKRVNSWRYPTPTLGRAGVRDDFLMRASLQCLAGIIANDPEEAVYLNTALDAEGQPLQGGRDYTLRFGPGELPPVKAFWSLTLYQDYNMVANPIDRFSIGDRTPGLRRDPDGSLTIYIQSEPPAGDARANWLPSPKQRPFMLILRAYLPEPEIIEQRWQPPVLREEKP
jgi:hypothetical protein